LRGGEGCFVLISMRLLALALGHSLVSHR
jgi:hypothetical protein